jgi:hypothetical protein
MSNGVLGSLHQVRVGLTDGETVVGFLVGFLVGVNVMFVGLPVALPVVVGAVVVGL